MGAGSKQPCYGYLQGEAERKRKTNLFVTQREREREREGERERGSARERWTEKTQTECTAAVPCVYVCVRLRK